ncbi:MAG: YigZ family protein [Clostridia bacterium]|jgi:uncharacterized YigZ family protein|nr:YigZ family protein [Clostridia bacterium]
MTCYYEANDGESTQTVRRSRFLTVVRRVSDEDAAAEIMSALRSKYHDATHVCYAYRMGERGQTAKFSDAGEPKGTAGAPILAAITENECTNTLCAVVRWFGGVKLGAGGLTRAYHNCAADALCEVGKVKYELKQLWRISCPLSLYSTLTRIAESGGARITEREFGENATFTIADAIGSQTAKTLSDAAAGRAEIERLEEKYVKQ